MQLHYRPFAARSMMVAASRNAPPFDGALEGLRSACCRAGSFMGLSSPTPRWRKACLTSAGELTRCCHIRKPDPI
jgi:hypothetical protein